MDTAKLVTAALEARNNSYSPYSHYRVGAALLTKDGSIFTGCNIENSSYGLTCCAERVALFNAVSKGEREFEALAIAGGAEDEEDELSGYAFPCGACRQVMSEFAGEDLRILVVRSTSDVKEYTLGQLLPESFGASNLE
ncbi:MAG: cytidine deaminase [Lachnospiraceae bacterium]|nr:cytidine deaminase [Lachnospiraceae bacterium]